MYQIEYRPGWGWERDFVAFNRALRDPQSGGLAFDGPYCKIEEWVALSQACGADYHVFEAKWHDGICYWNTQTTAWKTPVDYAEPFARLSRERGIPFMFYYSTVFDHNPELDPIQPNPHATMSFIGMREDDTYIQYVFRHFEELIQQHRPDGMWFDIYFEERSTQATIEFFNQRYPETVITYNNSNLYPAAARRLHYTCSEVHALDGPLMQLIVGVPVPSSCWKWANIFRANFAHPWELVTPLGRFWQDPEPRDDPLELVRMAAIVMACGGRLCMGATALMDGEIHAGQVEQLRVLGEWVRPRKHLFSEGVPLGLGPRLPRRLGFRTLLTRTAECSLLHIVNMGVPPRPLEVTLAGGRLHGLRAARLEPMGREVSLRRVRGGIALALEPSDIDAVDTIVSLWA